MRKIRYTLKNISNFEFQIQREYINDKELNFNISELYYRINKNLNMTEFFALLIFEKKGYSVFRLPTNDKNILSFIADKTGIPSFLFYEDGKADFFIYKEGDYFFLEVKSELDYVHRNKYEWARGLNINVFEFRILKEGGER